MKRIIIVSVLVVLVLVGAAFLLLRKPIRVEMDLSKYQALSADTAAISPGTYAGSLQAADGRTRTYLIHIPARYAASRTYPLVLLFHGGAGTGERILDQTKFEAKADAEGFIVVAPNGIENNWNDGRGTTDAELAGADDVGFVRQLTADLSAKLPIDKKRMYATGPSNGGLFSQRLGCELADVLAAIGPDVGPMPSLLAPLCKPAGPVAVVGIQGTADPAINIDGGEATGEFFRRHADGGGVESAVATMQLWASKNRCNLTPVVTHEPPAVADGTSVDRYEFEGCAAGGDITYYIVHGMGHGWPPHGGRARVSGPASANINATDVIWDFFKAHPKP